MISDHALEAALILDRLERLARADEQSGGLNPAQWEALRYLARANRFSRTPAALADYLGSTRGTVSRTLIALEDKGFVEKQPSPTDGRSIHLALTRLAEQALERDPVLTLARDIEAALGAESGSFAAALRRTLVGAVARNGGRPFGACFDCRYFRRNARPDERAPHHCALLNEALSQRDSEAICVEQAPIAA